jgi:flagellar basal-body rod modification protein FlgD
MSLPISTILSNSGAAPVTDKSKVNTTGSHDFDEDTFLKLLVAQLKYQDPSKPVDSNEFMSQTAEFTQVQKLQQMAEDQLKLISGQQLQNAAALIGRTVTYTAAGKDVTGVVSSATLTGTDPVLRVGTKDVPLSTVSRVTATTPAA